MFVFIPIPPASLCTLLACDSTGGVVGRWTTSQLIIAIVLAILTLIALWVRWDDEPKG